MGTGLWKRKRDNQKRAITLTMVREVLRRCQREPVSRIIGRREFWDLELEITPFALDPRPDSETLIEAA